MANVYRSNYHPGFWEILPLEMPTSIAGIGRRENRLSYFFAFEYDFTGVELIGEIGEAAFVNLRVEGQ